MIAFILKYYKKITLQKSVHITAMSFVVIALKIFMLYAIKNISQDVQNIFALIITVLPFWTGVSSIGQYKNFYTSLNGKNKTKEIYVKYVASLIVWIFPLCIIFYIYLSYLNVGWVAAYVLISACVIDRFVDEILRFHYYYSRATTWGYWFVFKTFQPFILAYVGVAINIEFSIVISLLIILLLILYTPVKVVIDKLLKARNISDNITYSNIFYTLIIIFRRNVDKILVGSLFSSSISYDYGLISQITNSSVLIFQKFINNRDRLKIFEYEFEVMLKPYLLLILLSFMVFWISSLFFKIPDNLIFIGVLMIFNTWLITIVELFDEHAWWMGEYRIIHFSLFIYTFSTLIFVKYFNFSAINAILFSLFLAVIGCCMHLLMHHKRIIKN